MKEIIKQVLWSKAFVTFTKEAVMDQASPFCKVALVNLDEVTAAIFMNAFRQFKIQTTGFSTNSYEGLGQQKFDGCVVRLSAEFEAILAGLRNSPRDRHVFIYGILVPGQTIQQVSKFGINTLMSEPVDRPSAIKIVRATHLLIMHEFRRYARIPLVTEVEIKSGFTSHRCTSLELSGGGMSALTESTLARGEGVECSFGLPGHEKRFVCGANICWVRPDSGMIGVRFDTSDPRRELIKKWIEEYLQM
jgi:PilZ domain